MTRGASAAALDARTLLDLQQVDERRFRSVRQHDNGLDAIFGGQFVAQALCAAQRVTPPWAAHSCTGYFLRAGVVSEPVDYEVEIVRDGRRYAMRRVLAWQKDKPVFDLLCSFHDGENGPAHQANDVRPAPSPEDVASMGDVLRAGGGKVSQIMAEIYERFPLELRVIDAGKLRFGENGAPERSYWLRMPSAADIDDARAHQCVLAFMSDYWFPSSAGAAHQKSGNTMSVASLNHTLWFHAPLRADEWLLFRTESPWTGHGRGLVRGMIYDRTGRLVASAAQEISMRETDITRNK